MSKEVMIPVKVYKVEMPCPVCRRGFMKELQTGSLAVFPPRYSHECEYCGHIETYSKTYPYMKLVEKDVKLT